MTQLKQWANYAVDEIDNCALELQMLKHREELKKSGKNLAPITNSNKKVCDFIVVFFFLTLIITGF